MVRELAQGHESAQRIQALLQKPIGENGPELAGQLVEKVLRSFELGLALLEPSPHQTEENVQKSSFEKHQISGFSSEDSGNRSNNRFVRRDGRGCYKRRKSLEATLVTVSPTMEDDQAWRKYGQKSILNSKFPRSYFRCTHKYEHGCKATKQVQMMEDDPVEYHITYIGIHTCNTHSMMMTANPPHNGDHAKEEVKEKVAEVKESDDSTTTIDNLSSLCSSLLEKPAFGLQDGRFEQSENTVSMMYMLGMEDDEALGRGFCDFHLDESHDF
ncbi:hypothetical protein SAY87_025988 [Trapa incisa]|uniref:WRKY domain-containing protein n=1 Tax=Trapa incisa TaxID=236973 RepID=A0AAN7GIL6_9MYRT|nr:hypothetical protein SAY87_025988 [Trapa incisa]